MPLIADKRPNYWKAIDPDPGSAQQCSQLGVRLIVRHHGEWDNGNPGVVTPEQFVDECATRPWWPHAWAVETPNEPHAGAGGQRQEHCDWMAEAAARLKDLGKECVVGNWGTGWDGYTVPGAAYYSCHEYGWPDVLSQQPFHALRHQGWWPGIKAANPAAQLFITECGVTQFVLDPHPPGHEGAVAGWRTGGLTAGGYAASLQQYAAACSDVEALFVYQFGGFTQAQAGPDGHWETFECLDDSALRDLISPGGSPIVVGPIIVDSGQLATYAASRPDAIGDPVDNGGGSDPHDWDGLLVQDFQGVGDSAKSTAGSGSGRVMVVLGASGPRLVRNDFYNRYLGDVNGQPAHSLLGAPTDDEHEEGANVVQHFEHGHMAWNEAAGASAHIS
jgi:hypothetical protein